MILTYIILLPLKDSLKHLLVIILYYIYVCVCEYLYLASIHLLAANVLIILNSVPSLVSYRTLCHRTRVF